MRTNKYGQKEGFVDLDTSSVESKRSKRSTITSLREHEGRKKTRVLGGHGMAVRDTRKGTQKNHKLFDNGK